MNEKWKHVGIGILLGLVLSYLWNQGVPQEMARRAGTGRLDETQPISAVPTTPTNTRRTTPAQRPVGTRATEVPPDDPLPLTEEEYQRAKATGKWSRQ
jgi:hypothetical protein